ncbi:MAG: iron-containing alcohol dehydrogenase [Rhizobiales bacterium]|nr:iron-containing alcohol dehydrogenase [Hyphomicrobiales bacterium]
MTEPFVFQSQAIRVLFGCGTVQSVPAELDRHKRSRALILCTSSSRPTAEWVQSHASGLSVDIHQLPPSGDARERLTSLIGHAREKDADSLVVIGGGSPIGFAKTIAAKAGLRSVAVITTYSGSEMSSSWSIGAGKDRMAGDDDTCLPLTAIYDPDLTLSLPPRTSAASGMNAMAHAVETLYGPDLNPVVKGLATTAVGLLGSSLPRVVDRPNDIAARTDALYGAWLAAAFRAQAGVEHALAQRVRQNFGLDHSHCHAIFTPYAIAFNAKAAPRAMELIARALGAADAGRALYELNVRIGLPTGLKGLGMTEADIPKAVDIVAAGKFANPRPVSREDLENLITQAYHGEAPRF